MKELSEFYTVRGYQLLWQGDKSLTPAMEDYLEMIYRNSLKEGFLRINTLSALLNVSAPSVTKMVRKMAELELISYKKYGLIALTENGRAIGKFLLERHNTIETFLKSIGVINDLFVETELMEHSVFAATLYRIELLNRFFEQNAEVYKRFKAFSDGCLDTKSEET